MAERRKSLSILGLPPGATDDDIRKAYKKLALQYHPDKNESDDAKGKFQEISNAYKNLTEGPGDFDGCHGAHGHDLRAEFLRRMFEEMFFPSFAFHGPRGFPFVFVDTDSDDECYYFDDDDSSDDNDYMFNSHGQGYRQFQNRYPGPTRPAQTQHEPSKKQQRKKEKRQRQRERAKEKKAQERNGNTKQWTSQDFFQTQSPDAKKTEPKSKETDKKSNQSDESKKPESQTKDNQSESRKTAESSQNQSKVTDQSEKQTETGSGTHRSETPNLSRPATPLETQQNPQKLTKKQRKKMESEQRKREQEMAEIAAELLRKQEREKEKQKEKERKAEQKDSEEKENERNIGWSPYDTKKMSRKARQRARRRQEAMPAETKQDSSSESDNDDSNNSNSDKNSNSDGKEAPVGNTTFGGSTGMQREPFKNVQQSNSAKFAYGNPNQQPGNTTTTKSKRSKIIRNTNINNSGTKQHTMNRGNQQKKHNRNLAGNQRNTGDPRYGVPTAPNRYTALDDFEDVIITKKPVDNDFQFFSSDSEVEDIISQGHPHCQHKGINLGFKTSAMGNNQSQNQSKGSKPNMPKGNNMRKNNSAEQKVNAGNENRQNQNNFPSRGRGRGSNMSHQSGDNFDMPYGGGRGASMSQVRGGHPDMPYSDIDDSHFQRGPPREYNEFNRPPPRGFNDFNGFHDRRMPDFPPQNFGPRGRQEPPFNPIIHDWTYGMNIPRQRSYGPPPFQDGPRFPPNFNNGPFPPHGYGPPGFEPPFHPHGGPFPFQRDSFRGRPPGFQTGPPSRVRPKGKGGRPYVDPHPGSDNHENHNGFYGNQTEFSSGNIQPGPGPNVPFTKTSDNYKKDVGTATHDTRGRISPMSGANSPAFSSSSGVSLDSLDEFSSSHSRRPNYDDNIQQRSDSGRKSPMYHGGLGYEGLVGMDALGVPKGFMGDRVKNYYS